MRLKLTEQFYTCVLSILALNGSEAGGDLVLIGPQCFLSVNHVQRLLSKRDNFQPRFHSNKAWLLGIQLGIRVCNLYYLTLIFLGIQEVCEAERALGIMWTKTGAGHYSRHPCPREAKGRGDPGGDRYVGLGVRVTRRRPNTFLINVGLTLKYLGGAFLQAL